MTRQFENLEELLALTGQEVAVSDWIDISQQRIATFADATDDHQWIHTDIERARRESPYGGPIAHGFLTLSLLPALLNKAFAIGGVRMIVNYGVNRVRFPAAVPAGSRVRARFTLGSAEPVEGGSQLTWAVTVEKEGGGKPVCVAELLIRCYD